MAERVNSSNTSDERISHVIIIPNRLYQSVKGKYFVGQTDNLIIGRGASAWGGLFNPVNSGVNLHVDIFAVSNNSDIPITARVWFNPIPPGNGTISDMVSPADTTLNPIPRPKVELLYVQSVNGVPSGGVNVFNRIIHPRSTLIEEADGKFNFRSKGAFLIYLDAPNGNLVNARIAFEWWEQRVKS